MKTTLEERISTASTLLDVLLILREMTMLDTHVATLAYFQSITEFNEYSIVKCKPFPLNTNQEEYTISAYCFNQNVSNLTKNSIILVIFTDRNFINNLNSVDKLPKETTDLSTHLIKYGIAILLNDSLQELSPEEKEEILDF